MAPTAAAEPTAEPTAEPAAGCRRVAAVANVGLRGAAGGGGPLAVHALLPPKRVLRVHARREAVAAQLHLIRADQAAVARAVDGDGAAGAAAGVAMDGGWPRRRPTTTAAIPAAAALAVRAAAVRAAAVRAAASAASGLVAAQVAAAVDRRPRRRRARPLAAAVGARELLADGLLVLGPHSEAPPVARLAARLAAPVEFAGRVVRLADGLVADRARVRVLRVVKRAARHLV